METGPKKKKLSANGKRVYHDLQEAGGDCGTEEQFYDFLNAPREQGYKNRRMVYEDLKKSGGDPGTYEQFAQWLGVHPIKPSAPVAAAQKPAAVQTAHPQQTAQAAAPVQHAPAAKPKPRNGRLTAAQRQAYIARAQQMSQQVGASVQRTNNRMDYEKARAGLRTPRVQLGSKASGGAKLGENSRVVATQPKFNPATGKMERVYLTELGNEYTSRAEADMEQNEIDEAVQQQLYPGYNDYNDKQAVAAQAPATAVAAQLWKEAQNAYDAERNANAKEVYGGNPWLRGGREMHVVDGATNSGKNDESRLKHFDLQKMSDNAWARVGKQMTASCYARLRKMYPNALERQVQASAEKEARALVQNAVYKYAVKMNAPKSQLDFFLRKAVDANLLTSVFRGLARYGAGTTGDMAAYEAANEEYGKSHRWTGVFGTATGMAFDPTNWVGVYVGSLGGRAALNIGGRFVLRSAPGVGARLFGSTMAGRLATGAASGMGMMGTYEGVKEAERQWVYGGHVNPETRENEGYSAGAVALSALKGAGLGAATGMVSPLVGNVADKVVHATTSATGKVLARAGEVATSAVAEGTIFAMPSWMFGNESFVDAWTESMAMIVGFKGQHMVKSAGQVIAGMRPVANPRTMEERNKNRRGFAENLKRTMDAGANKQWNANQPDVRFTKEELAELKQRGYGNLASLLTPTEKVLPKKKPSQPKHPKNTDGLTLYFDVGGGKKEAEADPKMKWLQQHPEFDGYATMEKLMQDPNVSQAARAKAYYMLTGRLLPMGTITGWNVGKDDKGNIWVKSVTSEGEVVTSRRFRDEASAKREEAKIIRQVELNTVDMGEQYKEMQANAAVVETAIKAVAPNADVNEAMRVYGEVKKGNKDYDSYKDLAKSIDEAIASNPEAVERAKTLLPENIRKDIAEQTGVEVDKALGKPEAERTDAEKQAVQTYLDRLYDKAASDDAATPPDAQLQGPEQFAEAYAKHRTHKGSGQVVPATMKAGDRKVYVIDGDVVQYADKSGIDVAKSDKSIVVCDAETGKYEYTSPDQLMNVGEPADPSTLSEAYMANERAKEAAANSDGTAEGNAAAESNAAANGDVSADGGKAEVVEPAYTDGSRVEINGHEYDVKSAGEKTVVLVDEHGKELAWTRSALDAKLESGDAEVLEPKAEAAPDVATEGLKAGDVFADSDGNALTVKRVDGDKVVAVGADGKEQTYEDGMFEQMVESGVLKRAQKTEEPSLREIKVGDVIRHKSGNEDTIVEIDRNDTRDGQWPKGSVTVRGSDGNTFKDNLEWYETLLNDPRTQPGGEYYKDNEAKVDLTDNQGNPTPQSDLSSESKGAEQSSDVQAEVPQVGVSENAPMPMRVVGKGKNAVQEEDWLATTPKRGHDYVFKESGLDAEEANAFVENKVAEAEKNLEKVKGKTPKMGTNIAAYKEAKADYEARVAEAQKAVDYWHAVKAERDKVLLEERRARKEKDKALYDDAVAQEEQRKAEMAQKAAEQEALGSNAVAPAIKEKWENAPKVDGGADEITLPNGEVVTGHYVLTESGAASASHQATNGFAETEGYPVDVNGETVNDRDYKRDAEAQQVTRGMAADYDSRALQSPVVVSGDGVVLSGNGRTMAGEIAALNGSDAKYNAYLRGHAGKFGFTTEQVEEFEHPRVVFVPDGEMPYTSETFAKFNQREQKSQSRTEMAVKLGKVVDDALFGRVMDVIGRHESLAEFYADDAATASVVKELADAGVIPQTEMAQLFDGGRLSEIGQAMVEGVLVGKVFQGSPDAVRQITEVKSMRKAVMAALPEVVACHRLGGGYDLSKELAAAVDLVYKARKAGFKFGQHVSQHARQGNLFQLDDGATVADYNNAAVMMLADVMNDGRVTQLKKVLSFYNTQAADSAQGIGDMFAGGVKSKGQIINEVNELLNNGQEYDRRTPSVADGQGVGGEGGEQGDVAGPSHQGGAGSERGLSEAFDGLAAQLKTAEGEERKRVLGEMRDGIARFAEENGYPVPEFLLTREDFLAAVPEKDRAKYVEWLDDGAHMPAYYTKGKVYVYVEGCETFDKDVNETLAHEYTHADNSEFPENVNALTYALEDTHEVTRDELREILREMSQGEHYDREAERLEAEGKDVNKMLADEVIAHAVARMVVEGEQVLDGITKNPTLQFIIKRAYKARENERQYNIRARENAERHDNASEGDNRGGSNNGANVEGESANGGVGRPVNGSEGGEVSSERGRSTVNEGKEVAAPSEEGAKVGVTNGVKSSATGDVVHSGEGETPLSEKIATASAEVNTEPTEAQKEAGNYKKGHVQVGTFDITIEQPQGSVRKGTDADGKQWENKMNNTYGYIRGAVGVDGDHIDVFLSNDIDGWNGRKVFVVDQYNPDGSFDEHKVMLGFNDADEAKSDYLANYENGWENGRRIDVTAVNLEDFEKWIASSKRKTKPFGEYSSVKNGVVENNAPVNEDTPSEIQTLLRERECTPISQEHRNLTDEGVVADNAGNPITLYHGTLDKSISVSELEAGHKRADGESADFAGSGVYFTPNKDVAEEYGYNGQVFEAHIKLSKPFYMLGNPGFNESEAVQFSNLLKSKGYDGIINYMNAWSVEHNMIDGGQVVVFNNSSILPIEKGQNNHAAYSITPSTYTNKKGESVERNEVLEYEKALDHLEDVEQKWGNKIQDYVFEHYPTQATTSAESTSEKGLQERKAMKADPVLKQMYAEAKKEIDAADEMVTQKYSALPEDLRQQKAVGKSAQPPTREESILRDVVIEHMKGSGLDVIGTEDGQRVLDMVNEDGAKEHRVYHGSGAEFDHFDHSHMGEGEGAQAYGWGTYVTEVRGIGEGYAIRSKNGISMSREEWSLKRSELESNIYRAKEQLPFLKGEYKAEVEAQISEWEEQLKDYEPHNYLYTVEIPDDNGGNYLDWNGHPSESLLKDVGSFLESNGFERVQDSPARYERGESTVVLNPNATGADLYAELQEALGSDKKASLALAELGYAGIKYPAEFRSGGRKDGAKNYVIFNENDAEITDHVRFFKTKNGEAYGFTVGGKIYYDPRIANAETPVHEYAHLWASALKANNAEEWKNVVDLMKGTNVWEEVKKTYPELETDDEIADEVLATYSGRRGAERLREEMRKAAAEGDGVMGKAEAVSALQRVKRAIDKFWKAVADFLHIHYTSAEEVADRVMKDLLDGVDPRSMMDGGKSLRPETRVNVVEAEAGHGFKNYAEAKTWAKEHIARTYSGEETGGKGDIRISNAAVDKYLSQSAVDKSESKDVHLAVLKVLPDVIRESVDAEQHADFKKGEDGVRSAANGVNPNVTIHRLYGAVRMDGKLYRVKVTLKEDVKSERSAKKAYSYEATKIELLAGTLVKPEGDDPNTNNSITAANLLNGVEKSYDGGKFFEDYNKIREQFIGEKGAAAADHAEEVNTRLDNLSVAREMEAEKKDAKAIKMATGWERGADGKWRYEVGDVRFYDGLQLINRSVKTEATLDDLLEDNKDKEALFASYPSLKNMPVVLEDMGYKGVGEYNYGKETIRLNTYLLTDDDGYFTKPAVEILNHEIQHAIQKIEGFARGGSPAMVRSEIKKQMAEVTKQIRQLRAEGKEAEAKELIKKNRGLYEASVGDEDFGSYKSLAGEVESRNVERRMGMSAEERRASLAAETEDVSREDQIFLTSGDGGNANSEMLQETGTENDYSEFAKEHGVDADMVKDYALGIKTGNLQKANFALTEIRRTMRVANRGMKLSEFGKLFRPVQKELAERYGDIEVLRQEYIDAEMRERGVMEAARKRAEEEAAKRKARADELRLLPEEELDRRYFEAVERGDDAAAREMLDEAARRKGYGDTESEYQGVGAWVAPSNPGYESDAARRADVEDNAPDVNVEDIALGYSLVDENYWHEPRKYMQTDATAVESVNAINDAMAAIRRGEKDVKVKVYRAVPTSVKEGKLRNGDWVTPSRAYAKMHGEHRLEGDYRIIEDEVPVNELWWDGNDSREWGFDDGKGYKYKNVENSRKLNDLVTRDDNGEIIAPSKRFDENVEDVRYRTSEELDQINQKFNERLDELVSNPNQKDKVLHLGRSSEFLKDGGISDAEIVLDYDKLVRKSKEGYKHEHPFDISDVRDLPVDIAYPIAVFDNTNGKNDGKVILTELKKDGRNFIVAIQTANLNRKGGKVLEVNKIVTLFPKDARGVVNWFNTGKATNIDKKKALHFIEALLNHSETTITNEELLSAANVVKDFETLQLSASEKTKQQAANDLARQMHVEGEVEVVTSTEGLTGRQAKAKGWYDVRTGRVTIVLPNNKNAADVRETVFHEVVAHKGLRNLVGEEHFNTFLDNVYNNAEEGIKQTIDEMAEKKYNGNKRKATEEYMAHLAEDGEYVKPENQGFFAKVRDFLTDLLRKVGIKLGFKLTDNDLRYILWRSWKGLAERDGGSVFEKAEDVKMQHELGQTDEARSASGENGIMFREGSDELKDVVEKMKADVERLHEGELDDLRSGARAIGGRLSELNKAMRLQRAYDMSTVASVTELAKTMLKNGLLSEMSDYDVRRLLSVVNNVHGKGDIRPYVQKVVDMMVGNRLRNVSKAFDKLLAMRGKKVDARGVEVQGELDLAGQRMADVVWKGIGMSDDDVKNMCADAQDRMMSANGAEAAAAATDYAGWQIVKRYNETIRDSKSEEVRLREDLKRAKEDYDAGRMTREAYMEFRESTNDAIRENRIERAEAYEELYEQLGGAYGESIKRAADFKAAEKARVLEIQHNANSDMEGRPARSYRKDTAVDKVLNSSPVQLLFAPLGTFDQMLRMFGSKNVKGEGYLWNRYMRGWLTAAENEYTGYRDATAELDAKAAEVLGKGKTWADLFALERKLPKATVRVWDDGEMRGLELPQGNLLYIYMVNKMADGRMKLRKMGVTEDDVAAIEDFIDPRLKEIGDWLQEVYLVEKRGKYNEVHERMFGAAMASIDNYFPLKILKDARAENVDVGVEKRESEMASTITGSFIKRKRNALPLDLLNSDAFSVVLDHLQEMEHISAYAEWNRDLNTLLSYKHFRNQVKNMRSAYGSGERLWKAFNKVARIAAGTYDPPKAFADKLAVNIAKGVTAAKILYRMFTAFKQLTSFPAYLSDSNPVYLLKGVANPYGSWKWCMENLPLFEKRWKSRMAGDPRLLKNEMDWSLWRDNVVQMAARWGMTPNAFVDALTVCIGARAMYETRRRKYIRYGYGLEEAERRAKQDASILYNQTQQSSEGAFLSALQVDRSWFSVMFTVFRNSSMSYTRQLYAALRNTGRRIAGGAEFKGISEAFMAKQMERDGIDPDRASKNAKAEYRKSWINDLVRAGVFGYVLQLLWNCSPYAIYMMYGDDEKKFEEIKHDLVTHTAWGFLEGLTGGDMWSAGLQSLWNHYVNGEDFNANSVNKNMPLKSDLLNVVKKVGSDNYGAVNDVLNLLVQAGFGVNPQTLTDAAVAIYDYCGSDVETTKECALLVMRVMNCPQSQMDNIYFDEIDATGEEAKAMSVEEIAERYARYKALRSAPLRALSSDALKAAEKKPRERVLTEAKEQLDGRLITEEAQRYLDEYEATKKKVTETRALADTDPKAFMQQMPALARSGEFRRYRRVGLYKREVDKLTKKLLRTSDPAERRALFGKMLDARDKMLKQVKEME